MTKDLDVKRLAEAISSPKLFVTEDEHSNILIRADADALAVELRSRFYLAVLDRAQRIANRNQTSEVTPEYIEKAYHLLMD